MLYLKANCFISLVTSDVVLFGMLLQFAGYLDEEVVFYASSWVM